MHFDRDGSRLCGAEIWLIRGEKYVGFNQDEYPDEVGGGDHHGARQKVQNRLLIEIYQAGFSSYFSPAGGSIKRWRCSNNERLYDQRSPFIYAGAGGRINWRYGTWLNNDLCGCYAVQPVTTKNWQTKSGVKRR